jgi:hypothetical protein
VPEVNGDGYSVDWSVPAGVNRSPRSPGTPRDRVPVLVAKGLLGPDVLLRPPRGLDRVFPVELERGPKDSRHDLGEPGEHEGQPPG